MVEPTVWGVHMIAPLRSFWYSSLLFASVQGASLVFPANMFVK